jgi:hypothetical protein
MSIISRTRPPVKPTRIKPRPAAPFGIGILAARPVDALPCCTVSDMEWWARQSNQDATDYDVLADAMALESAAQDAYERGFPGVLPLDLADAISRTGLNGYPA